MISSLSVIALTAAGLAMGAPVLESTESIFSVTVTDIQVASQGRGCLMLEGSVDAHTDELAQPVFASSPGRPTVVCSGLGGSLPVDDAATFQVVSFGSVDVDSPFTVEFELDQVGAFRSQPFAHGSVDFSVHPDLNPGACVSLQRDWQDAARQTLVRVTVSFCATT
ncbi:hypothetical protein F4553_007917 [Allocatelliglobosispora scoriae]|uniref:Secreted protein n=1 Tax=Allocatelliglobosispora scoriae TaxID=643052 RepID=A0A841C5S7_9ACTN|nr:hypothetical protein [Allocatelliglobosispora scoriae]MBB5874483.1 hypothetical protein [Allocatelliglobosispora scoriae]